jgi:NADH-quinone oxidoreductase subunit A
MFLKYKLVFQKEIYECGFKTLLDLNINININFLLFCSLLVLYDIEFLFLSPFLISFVVNSYIYFIVLTVFYFIIIFTFYIDLKYNILYWSY